MRIALCQINSVVGDFAGNARAIVVAAEAAQRASATLAVYPELALMGYPPRDFLDRPAFVTHGRKALATLAAELPKDLSALVGFVDVDDSGPEWQLYNAAALLEGGAVAQVFHKRLLPRYDVFDELRYFTAGQLPLTFMHRGMRVGVTICEDAWNDADTPLRKHYRDNPMAQAVEEGAELLVNLSASPFTREKLQGREALFAGSARRHGVPVAVTNLVGCTDELIFDGNSALFASDGSLLARAERFSEDVLCCSLGEKGRVTPLVQDEAGAVFDALVLGVRDYARKCGFSKALIGLSGGVDSALVAAVAAQALGPAQVLGVAMPTRYSSEGSLADAAALAQNLGIQYRILSIDGVFERFMGELNPLLADLGPAGGGDTTYENLQARIRGTCLMSISNRLGHLLLTTGNKSEVAVGYCTLYGDMAGGLAVISDLLKTFVYQVCRSFNSRYAQPMIPESILTKAPSAELRPDQTDQDSLPPYEVLDRILAGLVEQGHSQEVLVAAGEDPEIVQAVTRLVRINEYKRRQMPPGLIVTGKAFGPGRRVPIAQRYGY